MRRVLILVLALAFAGSAVAAPTTACVPRDGVRTKPHPCCEVAVSAPVGPCCIVTAPALRVSSTETRLVAPDQTAAIPRAGAGLFAFNRERASNVSPPLRRGSPVPIYLQQLALLI
jgi:hypothetical protein